MDKFADCEATVAQPPAGERLCLATVVTFAVIFSGNLNDLVQHGLRALRETLPAEQDLTTKVRLGGGAGGGGG